MAKRKQSAAMAASSAARVQKQRFAKQKNEDERVAKAAEKVAEQAAKNAQKELRACLIDFEITRMNQDLSPEFSAPISFVLHHPDAILTSDEVTKSVSRDQAQTNSRKRKSFECEERETVRPVISEKRRRLIGPPRSILADVEVLSPIKSRGFINAAGVECYRSSLLHALFNTETFIKLLYKGHEPSNCLHNTVSDTDIGCLACYMREHIANYWGLPGNPELKRSDNDSSNKLAHQRSLTKLLRQLKWGGGVIDQEDPHEFMLWLINKLESCMPSSCKDELHAMLSIGTEKVLTACISCGKTSVSSSIITELDASLLVRQKSGKLEDYIAASLQQETESYKCGHCTTLAREAAPLTRRHAIKITSSPKILAVHILPYNNNGEKLHVRLAFPAVLDLTQHGSEGARDNKLIYELYSVVSHKGAMNSGHYINHTKLLDTGAWWGFDDEVATASSQEAILKGAARFGPSLLFYRRA